MVDIVLDASALLAFVRREPGGDCVGEWLNRSAMSAVNLAEVIGVSVEKGAAWEQVDARLRVLPVQILPFEREDAQRVAALRTLTRDRGLSLADRACIALGQRLGTAVLTADKTWTGLAVDVDIRFIR